MQDVDLRPYLRAARITTKQLMDATGACESTVIRWKRRGRRIRLEVLLLCASLAQRTPAELFPFLTERMVPDGCHPWQPCTHEEGTAPPDPNVEPTITR